MQIEAHILSAFGKTPEGGNPAGVVFDAQNLSVAQKMEVARVLGFSESAFVSPSDTATYKVEFFTSNKEIDMCGHATVATFFALYKLGVLKSGTYSEETKAGILPIDISDEGLVTMDQLSPTFLDTFSYDAMADVLNIDPAFLATKNLLPQTVSTGFPDIMVHVDTLAHLLELNPDLEKISKLNEETNTTGLHVFTLETMEPTSAAHCRNFSPFYGIPEDPATGGDAGALASFLYSKNLLASTNRIVIEQGYSMQKPSEMVASLDVEGDAVTRVRVGGRAIYLEKRILDV